MNTNTKNLAMARSLLFVMGLLLSCNAFATSPTTRAEIDALQAQVDSLLNPTTYALGAAGPDGGIVYYVDGSGEHGLAAQAADAIDPDDVDNFLTWTAAVTAASAYGPGWHLPTKTELELLYEQKSVVGGFAGDGYWSSTEYVASFAWYQYFFIGVQFIFVKNNTLRVRAVRAF